jgi:hypothetical protein
MPVRTPFKYRYPNGRVAGVVVIESGDLLHARLKGALAVADRELEFASGHQLDPVSTEQIPANMIGRLLTRGDLRRLQRALMKLQRMLTKKKKKPPAPSVRHPTAAKRRMGNR